MKATVIWNKSMEFEGQVGDHRIEMDARPPIGKGSGATPKELLAIGLGGCTAMDVVALLKKYKQPVSEFSIDVELESAEGVHPVVFVTATLVYSVSGDVEPNRLLEAVELSQSRYCSLSAMLSKAFPINYRVMLNGLEVGRGSANFDEGHSTGGKNENERRQA